MLSLLIIADDFTGALDTGVFFAESGVRVKVVTDTEYPFDAPEAEVLVVDAETRHLSGEDAYRVVYGLVSRGRVAGIPHFYKKTDSGLRGNIGAELQAVLDALGENTLAFLPAFPKMKRVTRQGIHYIDGVPVDKSVFGIDPFEPVDSPEVAGIIAKTSSVPTENVPAGAHPDKRRSDPRILVYDAETDEDIKRIAGELKEEKKLTALAGCAGFASALPGLLLLGGEGKKAEIPAERGVFVACGSVNPVTRKQLDYGEKHGYFRLYLTPEQKLKRGFWTSPEGIRQAEEIVKKARITPFFILDTNDPPGQKDTARYAEEQGLSKEELRLNITSSIGFLVRKIMESGLDSALMIMGGDTLLGSLGQMKVKEMEPVRELFPGVVLARFPYRDSMCRMITKSGGFGSEFLLGDLARVLCEKKKEKKDE